MPTTDDGFDAAGNTTSDGTVTYEYSDRTRLMHATKAAVPTNYLYNAMGQRMSGATKIGH